MVFFGLQGLFAEVELSPSFGFTQVNPIGCSVTGSTESVLFDEGLHQ
jgi:hypothetical protein